MKKIIDGETSTATYGPYSWEDLIRTGVAGFDEMGITVYVKISGTAEVNIQGSPTTSSSDRIIIDDGDVTASKIVTIQARVRHIWFDIPSNSGTVDLWVD